MLFDELKQLITRYERPAPEQLSSVDTDFKRLTNTSECEQLSQQIERQKLTMLAKMHFHNWQLSINRQIASDSCLRKNLSAKTASKIFEIVHQAPDRKYEALLKIIEALYALKNSITDSQEAQAILQCILLLTAYKVLAEASGTRKQEIIQPQPTADCASNSAPKIDNSIDKATSSYAELLELLNADPALYMPELTRTNRAVKSREDALERLNSCEAVNSVTSLISQLEYMRSKLTIDFALYGYLTSTIKLCQSNIDNLTSFIGYIQHHTTISLKTLLESYIYAEGKKTNVSVLTCLLKNPLAILLFEIRPEITNAISSKAMNNLIKENTIRGEFPVFILFLIFEQHFNYFKNQPRLVSLITQRLFLQKFSKLDNLSPAEYLMSRPDRRSFFTLNPKLIDWLPSQLKKTFEQHFSPRIIIEKTAVPASVPTPKDNLLSPKESLVITEIEPAAKASIPDKVEQQLSPRVSIEQTAVPAPVPTPRDNLPAPKESLVITENEPAAKAPVPDKVEPIIKKLAETKLTESTAPKVEKGKSATLTKQDQQITAWKKAIDLIFGEAQNLIIDMVLQETDYFKLRIRPPEINSYWQVKTSKANERVSRFYATKTWFDTALLSSLSKVLGNKEVEVVDQFLMCKIAWNKVVKLEQINNIAKKIINALKTSSADYHNALRKPVSIPEKATLPEAESSAPASAETLPEQQELTPKSVQEPVREPVVEKVVNTEKFNPLEIQFAPEDALRVYRYGLRARYQCTSLNAEHHSVLRNNEFWRLKLNQHFRPSVIQAADFDQSLSFVAQFPAIAAQEYRNLPDNVIDMFIYAKEKMLVSSMYEGLLPLLFYTESSGRSLLNCIRETHTQQVIDCIFSLGMKFFRQQASQGEPAFIQSLLHWAICCNQRKAVISELLQSEAAHTPFTIGDYHYFAIHRAVYESAYEAVEAILEQSLMQLTTVDSLNRSPFNIAYSKQDKHMLDLLGYYYNKAAGAQNSRFFIPMPYPVNTESEELGKEEITQQTYGAYTS
ncbi:ankyrin repeat domain-containing protein [Legionella genomosp. 1]|uniref:ankyrin repeat domain-containing protein n=1 Tax=Legionella genomosp. 1 TaxID=1093625 RepID=UPI0010562FF8|nr:ankyrin repeat domain-containing protein [Legionella genomosp. 1]